MNRIRSLSVVLAIALMLAACGKDNSSNPTTQANHSLGGSSGTGSDTGAITDLNAILNSHGSLVNREVQLDQVKAHDVYWAVFTITQGNSGKMPVAVAAKLSGSDSPSRHHVRKGELLRITGTIQNAPAYNPNDPFWRGVGPKGRQLIERTGIYINATNIQPSFGGAIEEEGTPPNLG